MTSIHSTTSTSSSATPMKWPKRRRLGCLGTTTSSWQPPQRPNRSQQPIGSVASNGSRLRCRPPAHQGTVDAIHTSCGLEASHNRMHLSKYYYVDVNRVLDHQE